MDWIRQNADILQLGLGLVSAVVWLAYLQILYLGFVRQRQAVIMIGHGAASDDRARCIVTNMGTEPIYVIAALAKLTIDGKPYKASVIDREELNLDTLDDPIKRTTLGPLKSGEYMDLGSFRDLIWRAERRLGLAEDCRVEQIELSIGAASGHATKLVIASRVFKREDDPSGNVTFQPTTLLTRQLRGGWNHRSILRQLKEDATA
ncbi:Cardiolipin synthetase [Sulfitobacter noctilucae]|uniref:hypothetical protein n=1 Tax=Sulfitobacter noctilucae TaxID=1342302 RepID=UPI00046ABD19|nr:hypothetical protein [Sulfitobacter noctilucae]KIN75351.1 Cardiolipin synthetase [Sulfitobacter noctilucae]